MKGPDFVSEVVAVPLPMAVIVSTMTELMTIVFELPQTRSSVLPDEAVPPVVSLPRLAVVPMLVALSLLERSRPPMARLSTSVPPEAVPLVKVMLRVAFVPRRRAPMVVFAATATSAVVLETLFGRLFPLARPAE